MDKKIEYSELLNSSNVIKYSVYDIKNDDYLYQCVICGACISISGSISYRGHRLICNQCVKSKFDSVTKAFMWVAE